MPPVKFNTFESELDTRSGLKIAMVLLSVVGIMTLVVAFHIFKITDNMTAVQTAMERFIEQRTQVRKVFSLIKDADLTYTRYMLTQRHQDMEEFSKIRARLYRESEKMMDVLSGEEEQIERGRRLAAFSRGFFDELNVKSAWGAPKDSIDGVLVFGSAKVRTLVDEMIVYNDQEIKRAQKDIYEENRSSRTVSIVVLGGVALLVAVVLIAGLFYLSSRGRVEKALLEANRLAEEANEAKTDFLATMSHEIRTPLTGVLGFTELLTNEKLTERQESLVQRIQTAGANLSAIVNDILDFSKIEAGQVTLDPTAFSLRSLIEHVRSMVWVVAESKNLELRVSIDPSLPDTVIGDEPRLRQVLLNLLSNAVKFTNEGHVHLKVRHRGTTDTGETIRIEVKDTGIGFSAIKRDRLFTRFSQLDASTRREFGGTGLGLAISRELIELMGGQIGAESVKGVGTLFWITCTMPKGADEDLPKADKDAIPSRAVGRVLLVEDSMQNQALITTVLRAAGHSVDIAGNGKEALEAVQKCPYDIILMDVQMPKMDGLSATRKIRDLALSVNRVPIIALTANVLPEQVGSFRQAGMNDFIAKPFKRADLLSKVSGWILAGTADYAENVAKETMTNQGTGFDAQTLADMTNLMGEKWVQRALRNLRTEVTDTFRDGKAKIADELVLKKQTHKIVSHAAQLGFLDLSKCCSDLEELCTRNRNIRPAFAVAQKASRLAVKKMDELIAATAVA